MTTSTSRSGQDTDRLLVVAAFVLDFLGIHPFLDGDGHVARLLIALLARSSVKA